MIESDAIGLEIDDGVATVTLDQPRRETRFHARSATDFVKRSPR
jgi:hypothetical protein